MEHEFFPALSSEERERIAEINKYRTPMLANPAVCAFVLWPSDDRRQVTTYPQSLFRVHGLWLWGTTDKTLIWDLRVGNQRQWNVSSQPIPGKMLEGGLPLDELMKLVEKDGKMPEVPPHQRMRWQTAEVGNTLLLDIEGPCTHAVAWGMSVQ